MEPIEKYLKVAKWIPIVFAFLGILGCGFALLYQTQDGKDKTDLLFFIMGALITFSGVLTLLLMIKILEVASHAQKGETKPEEDEVEGL